MQLEMEAEMAKAADHDGSPEEEHITQIDIDDDSGIALDGDGSSHEASPKTTRKVADVACNTTIPVWTTALEHGDDDDANNDTTNDRPGLSAKPTPYEGTWTFLRQLLLPFLVAGAGMVCAGIILDKVQNWTLFITHPEALVLVPTLLGLKGNLGMTLGSRLSTLANLGRMNTRGRQIKVFYSNVALDQTLATIVAFLASILAIIITTMKSKELHVSNAVFMCAMSMITASVTSLALDAIMMTVVLLSRRAGVNPDNVTTPIAGAVGDVTTLTALVAVGTVLMTAPVWLTSALVVGILGISPLWMWLASRDCTTLDVLKRGWYPIIAAMLISSAGGFILENAIEAYEGIASFLPVINGVGGNLVAVQSSRLGTSLHQTAVKGRLPSGSVISYLSLRRAFLSNDTDARTARVLLFMVVPTHCIFLVVIFLVKMGQVQITVWFVLAYLLVAVAQVFVLLYLCQWLVRLMWRLKMDPDYNAIPYLTALGDLLGTGLLGVSFVVLYSLGGYAS